MQQHSLPSAYRYIRLAVTPSLPDGLSIRKAIQDGLTQMFGVTSASTYLDILWTAADGSQHILRVPEVDAAKILAMVASMPDSLHLSVIKHSPFLPSLLTETLEKVSLYTPFAEYLFSCPPIN
ncbi:hypothetical protein AMATHDRAFT_145706 [Amanita thiersii Skay4041]|uniref:Ribonucleases P/MRP subunit Pop8-like domain-containing protein n=1 Tax=Amanita thiersii Skay4041 TaxID=703135 RepID=A0A2A9NRA8_9AGAR|nr:hypothetical protein AMATHDRAFT_145706 [Amanita thiersii Skay4041]